MGKQNAIALLTECKPLAQHLIKVFDLGSYSLSQLENQAMKLFFQLRAHKNYTQLKFLSNQADLTIEQLDCLEEMYLEMTLRYLKGRNMQTGRKLGILFRWLQWLDVKLNWEVRLLNRTR